MLIIESNLTVSSASSWVLDSGSSAHLCTSMQDREESRRLRDGEMILCIENGARVAAVAVEILPSAITVRIRFSFKRLLLCAYSK